MVANIDGATGIVTVDPARIYTQKDQTIIVCPGMNGGKNWPAGAYSPRTNAMYMPMQNQCMNARTQADGRDASLVYGLEQEQMLTPGNPNQGTIWAISAQTGDVLWKREQRAGVMSMVATGGGLIFGGDVGGNFRAYDEKTGDVVWETNVGARDQRLPRELRRRRQAVRRGDDGLFGRVQQRAAVRAGVRCRRRRTRRCSCSRCRSARFKPGLWRCRRSDGLERLIRRPGHRISGEEVAQHSRKMPGAGAPCTGIHYHAGESGRHGRFACAQPSLWFWY